MQADHVVLLCIEKLSTRTAVRDFLVAKVLQSCSQFVPLDVARGWLGFDFFNDFVCLCHVGWTRQPCIVTNIQLLLAVMNFKGGAQGYLQNIVLNNYFLVRLLIQAHGVALPVSA